MVWWNYFTYSSIGIRLSPTTNERVITFRPAKGPVIERAICSHRSDVLLVISCGEIYRFGFNDGSSPHVNWVGDVGNQAMTQPPPIGAPFTGMMMGLYAFGDRQPCLAPADFEFAEFSMPSTD